MNEWLKGLKTMIYKALRRTEKVIIGMGGGDGPNLAVLRGVAVPADPVGELLGPGE